MNTFGGCCMRERGIRYVLLFVGAVLLNLYLLGTIEMLLFQRSCFDYQTAFENFRNGELTEANMDFLLCAKKEGVPDGKVNSAEMEGKVPEKSGQWSGQVSWERFSERLTMYFSMGGIEKDPELLQECVSYAKQYHPEQFEAIRSRVEAMWTDAVCFPVGPVANDPKATVEYGNSWKQSRTFGGDRVHEGCDLMASVNVRGIYPVYSVSDGVVEKIGWLRLGGYRIGIRSEHGVYFYYAHLAEYAKEFQTGETVKAGTLLGYMGDTGYSDIEGTTGKFPVHLHFGIYFDREDGGEFSVNPYPLLRYLETQEKETT